MTKTRVTWFDLMKSLAKSRQEYKYPSLRGLGTDRMAGSWGSHWWPKPRYLLLKLGIALVVNEIHLSTLEDQLPRDPKLTLRLLSVGAWFQRSWNPRFVSCALVWFGTDSSLLGCQTWQEIHLLLRVLTCALPTSER